jgi:hypothetical protein
VEKLVFILMGPPPASLQSSLLGSVPALKERGAARIQVNVVDESLGHPFGVAPDDGIPQLSAAVTMWVDAAEGTPLGSVLPPFAGCKWHGYLVTESEPLRNEAHPPGPDGRVPGFAQIVALSKPSNLSWASWRREWQGRHTPIAMNTQSTFRYVQNVMVRPLTAEAPPYAALVEECFPAEATKDMHVFFDAVGDDAKLSRHMAAMSESCDRFMDGDAPVAWTTEYVFS